jgi:hypothetical protein
MVSIFFPTEAATIPIVLMVYRSDRRGIKPITLVASEAVVTDWLPARGFHHGREWRQRSTNRPKIRLQSDPHITIVMSAAVERNTALMTFSGEPGGPLPIALRSNHGARRCQGFPRCARRLASPLTPTPLRGSRNYGRWAAGGLRSSGVSTRTYQRKRS